MAAASIESRLLNDFQRDFPLVPRPFARIADALGVGEDEVLEGLAALQAAGKVSRVGAVIRPNSVGASTLAALAVPQERLAEVAAIVSARPEVNHNYEREHRWNLWFVVAAPSRADVLRAVAAIEAQTGLAALELPLVTDFHIDLGFDLDAGGSAGLPA